MTNPDPQEDFGPGGYLPPRAAKRARKIVLRRQMGLGWPLAALVAGALILVVTVPFVLTFQGPPGEPYTAVGPLGAVDSGGDARVSADGAEVLIVRAGGALHAFVDVPDGVAYCPASRRLESPRGEVWTLQGRLIAGEGGSLSRADVVAYDDVLYVDVSSPQAPLPPRPGDQHPACR